MRAIGSRNLLKSYAKQREAQQDQLRALIGKEGGRDGGRKRER